MKPEFLFQRKTPALLLALLTMALWGSLFPVVKLGYRTFQVDTACVPDILLFAGLRFTVCGGLYVLLYSLSQRRFSVPASSTWPSVLWLGLFSIVLHYSFTYIGLAMNGGAKTAIVKQLGTLFAVCFGFLFQRGERFSWRKCAGGVLGFASILLINLDGGLSFHFNIGEFLVMLASFCTVAAGAAGKRAYQDHSPVLLTAYAQLSGGLLLLAVGFVSGGRITPTGWEAAGIFAYLCAASLIAYALWNTLLKFQNLSDLFLIKFTETLFAAVFSAMLLGEDIFRFTYLGSFVLICLGIALNKLTVPASRRKKEDSP